MSETVTGEHGIPDVPPERIREAAALFDVELRQAPEWRSWTDDVHYRWALELDGNLYPVKEIVRRATGATSFSGGSQANGFLTSRGFTVVPLPERAAASAPAIHLLLKWARQHAGDTIEQHKRIADESGSVWWGIFGNRDRTPLSQTNVDRLRRQISVDVPTAGCSSGYPTGDSRQPMTFSGMHLPVRRISPCPRVR